MSRPPPLLCRFSPACALSRALVCFALSLRLTQSCPLPPLLPSFRGASCKLRVCPTLPLACECAHTDARACLGSAAQSSRRHNRSPRRYCRAHLPSTKGA
eukprot:6183176-Pleurochrysis_carterae.AAC.3